MMEVPSLISTPDGSVSPSNGDGFTALASSTPAMFRSLAEVFGSVVPQEQIDLGIEGWPKVLENADSDFDIGKALRTVVSILQYLKETSSVILVPATKILADGSRHGTYSTNLLNLAKTTIESQLKVLRKISFTIRR